MEKEPGEPGKYSRRDFIKTISKLGIVAVTGASAVDGGLRGRGQVGVADMINSPSAFRISPFDKSRVDTDFRRGSGIAQLVVGIAAFCFASINLHDQLKENNDPD